MTLLERAADLLETVSRDMYWNQSRTKWLRDYHKRCRADFSNGDAMPDHRGCPEGAECDGKDIYWRPDGV